MKLFVRSLIVGLFAWLCQVCGTLVMVDDGLMAFEAAIAASPVFIVIGAYAGLAFLNRYNK